MTLDILPKLIELLTALVGLVATFVGLSEAQRKTGDSPATLQGSKKLRGALAVSFVTFAIIIALGVYGWASDRFLSWALAAHDPDVFSGSKHNGVARIFVNRDELLAEGRYGQTIRETNKTFDLLAISGTTTLQDFQHTIEDALKKNISIRVLLFDASEANRDNCKKFAEAIGEDCEADLRPRFNSSVRILRAIQLSTKDPATYRGRLTFKVYQRFVLYTMWLRDVGGEASLGHIEVHQYRPGTFQLALVHVRERGRIAS